MINLIALNLLLSFCDGQEFKYYCKDELRTCFEKNIERKITVEKSFKDCLGENYERLILDDRQKLSNIKL